MTTELQHRRHEALSDRSSGTVVGALYIVGTSAGISARLVTGGSGPSGPDHLANASTLGDRLATGALLLLVMALALAAIPLVAFPVLRATSQRLALGYVLFRGALETSLTILVASSWLVLRRLGEDAGSTGQDTTSLQTATSVLAQTSSTIGTVAGTIVFLIGAAMFYSVLYRARLVPRWLSTWGLVAVVPYLGYAVLAAYGVESSTLETVLDAPLGLQELVLAVWLVAKGFQRQPAAAADRGA